jgi:hypothetical protein
MKYIPRGITSRHYPAFIKESYPLRQNAKQDRVWPEIGLDNCEEQIDRRRKIVFSGSGYRALWDIATMSMRGISSCQSWNGSHRSKVIGSMADPYCGIIYTTTGKETNKGTRMSRRALVRFVIHRLTGRPALLVERIYPVDPDGVFDYRTFQLFSDFLRRKTNNKFPILQAAAEGYFIPMAQAVRQVGEDKWSYRDSHIPYSSNGNYPDVKQTLLRVAAEQFAAENSEPKPEAIVKQFHGRAAADHYMAG